MPERTTLREVAEAAGVSVSTASLALAGSVRIAEATARRVREAAAALGYVRDQAQAAAAAGRFRHAGKPARIAVWGDDAGDLARLRRHGEGMGMAVVPIAPRPGGLAQALSAAGAVAAVVQRRGLRTAELAGLQIPAVLWCDEGEGDPAADLVETCEWWTAAVQALERMRAVGHRRLAAVLTPASPRHWHDEVRRAALRAAGVPVMEWDGSWPPIAAFLARHRPDAVLGGNIHILRALQRHGATLPFAALLTYDTPWHRPCAGWRADAERRARMTLELIEQRLRYGPRPPCRIVIPPRWHAGASLPPAAS